MSNSKMWHVLSWLPRRQATGSGETGADTSIAEDYGLFQLHPDGGAQPTSEPAVE